MPEYSIIIKEVPENEYLAKELLYLQPDEKGSLVLVEYTNPTNLERETFYTHGDNLKKPEEDFIDQIERELDIKFSEESGHSLSEYPTYDVGFAPKAYSDKEEFKMYSTNKDGYLSIINVEYKGKKSVFVGHGTLLNLNPKDYFTLLREANMNVLKYGVQSLEEYFYYNKGEGVYENGKSSNGVNN